MKKLAWAGVGLLYLLHNDVWLWSEPHRLPWAWSLPAGFVYHVVFCVAAALLFWLIVCTSSFSPLKEGGPRGDLSVRRELPERPGGP